MPSFEGNLLTQRHQITSSETRDPRLPYGKNPEYLSHLGFIRYRVVTPGRADRRTDGQTEFARSQQYLPVQLSRVKKPPLFVCVSRVFLVGSELNLCRYRPARRTCTYFGGGTPYRQFFLSQYGGTLCIYEVQTVPKVMQATHQMLFSTS